MKHENKLARVVCCIKTLFHRLPFFKSKKSEEIGNIISLSPNPRLSDAENDAYLDFLEYQKELRAAFQNQNIQNIAITGNHGVGKSSIIRSYEAQDKDQKKGYFYISLMDFKYIPSDDDEANGRTEEEEERFQQEFERYLLCQILSKADASSLPHSMFKLIPTHGKLITKIVAGCLSLLVLCVATILLRSQLGISENFVMPLICACGALSFLPLVTLAYTICNSISSAKVSAKYGAINLETEAKKEQTSYIDEHIFEIIYALETMAPDIGYTVVLEDIDRLGKDICIDIFSKMRRINILINDRKKLKNNTLRFVYAFNDSVFELAKNTKFFDYVMSVTPRLNYNTSGLYFKQLMLNAYPEENERSLVIRSIIKEYDIDFWNLTGYVIHDYRTLNHIRNDFHLFANIMNNRKAKPDAKWLPFIIYKNLLAEDYCNAFDQPGVLELGKEERAKRLEKLCATNGEYYVKLITNLFDYICDNIGLRGTDFQVFTGLPKEIVAIRDSLYRNVEIEDLISGHFEFDKNLIGNFFEDKCVMITGGAGSIGGELCRKLAEYGVSRLVIVDTNEATAYDIQQEFKIKYQDAFDFDVEIVSVLDVDMLDGVFEKYKPQIVFHSAARKNVLLMEDNPEEAIKTNIVGTYNAMCSSEKYGVEKFVLISTDKAVNPTNVMGATKRFAEMLIQAHIGSTKCTYIRFGNVLGANGSVIPFFQKQIAAGGPVTLVHPDIIRYFMTVSEASLLILATATMEKTNRGYALDMGTPVKILDLAKNMIRLAGLTPDKDIKIEFTGLRPGEKLYEEILTTGASLNKTKIPKVFTVTKDTVSTEGIEEGYNRLLNAIAQKSNERDYKMLLKELVPTYYINMN